MKKERLFRLTANDFEWKATRGSGPGGQNRNKVHSAMHCFHKGSGASGYAEDTRDQLKNKRLAFQRLTETSEFKQWLRLKIDAYNGKVEITEVDDSGKEVTRKLSGEEVK